MSKDARQEGNGKVSGSLKRLCRSGTERCKKEVKMSDRYAIGFWKRETVGWRVMRMVGKLDNCCQCGSDVVVVVETD